MKIGIIADIHSNIYGLKAVLSHLKNCNLILCAGDITGYYTFVNEVFEEIRGKKIRCILGNHDAYLLGIIPVLNEPIIKKSIDYTKNIISKENLDYLKKNNKPSLKIEVDGLKIKIYHGNPWNQFEGRVYPDYVNFDKFKNIDEADMVILGHTHYPLIKKIGKTLIFNPGSCGQPRKRNNDKMASFGIFDTKSKRILLGGAKYNINRVCEEVINKGLDNKLAEILKK